MDFTIKMAKKDIDKNIVFILLIIWISISLTGAMLVLQKQRTIFGSAVAEVKVNVVSPTPPAPPSPGGAPQRPSPPVPEEIPEEIEEKRPEVIIPEAPKLEVPSVEYPAELVISASARLTLIAAVSIAVLSITLVIIGLLSLYEFAVLDTEALLFVVAKKIPLKTMLTKVFGKRVKIAITQSTMKELNVLAKSPNIRIRKTAAKALKMIDKLKISVKKKAHLKLAKKKRMHIIAHKKSLIKSLNRKNLSFHSLEPAKKGFKISNKIKNGGKWMRIIKNLYNKFT